MCLRCIYSNRQGSPKHPRAKFNAVPAAKAIVIQHPAVNEVAVFGVPSDKWGESPVAAVVCSEPVDEEVLKEWTNERVDARFQKLASVHVLQEFPRNVAGKILKRELRDRYTQ